MHETTLLLVGHGSREDSGNQDIRRFVEQWRVRQPHWRVELGFIEFATPSLAESLRRAARGSRHVLVLPLILNAAGHVKMEIPEAIEAARADQPGVRYLYGPHLGPAIRSWRSCGVGCASPWPHSTCPTRRPPV